MDSANSNLNHFIEELNVNISLDGDYRQNMLSMTASENYQSKIVRMTSTSLAGGFYHFSFPFDVPAGEWTFPESGFMNNISTKVAELGKKMVHSETFDWRPNGGSAAEQVLLFSACKQGDGFIHFSHSDGGHFALEPIAEKMGIEIFHFPVDQKTLLVDVEKLSLLMKRNPHIKLAIMDQSFKLRYQDIKSIRSALPDYCLFTYDMSHDGAFIMSGHFRSPLELGADVVHGNTHKTIAGPQKAYLAFKSKNHPLMVNTSLWICPHLQSTCHAELLPPMYLSLKEIEAYGTQYSNQMIKNAKALGQSLINEGLDVSGQNFGLTETHQIHFKVGDLQESIRICLDVLHRAGIRSNNIEIPGDKGQYGIRLGVQAMTKRGFIENDFAHVGKFVGRLIIKNEDPIALKKEISEYLRDFPLYPLKYSFDEELKYGMVERVKEVFQ